MSFLKEAFAIHATNKIFRNPRLIEIQAKSSMRIIFTVCSYAESEKGPCFSRFKKYEFRYEQNLLKWILLIYVFTMLLYVHYMI